MYFIIITALKYIKTKFVEWTIFLIVIKYYLILNISGFIKFDAIYVYFNITRYLRALVRKGLKQSTTLAHSNSTILHADS